MMGRRKSVIKLKNVMEKYCGVVGLTSPSPSPSVLMTRPKGFATYIRAAFMPSWLRSQNALEQLLSLTCSSFIDGQGRTSSSVLDLISDYEYWNPACVILVFFGDD